MGIFYEENLGAIVDFPVSDWTKIAVLSSVVAFIVLVLVTFAAVFCKRDNTPGHILRLARFNEVFHLHSSSIHSTGSHHEDGD